MLLANKHYNSLVALSEMHNSSGNAEMLILSLKHKADNLFLHDV